MKVKVGSYRFASNDHPVMIIVNDAEKQQIADMSGTWRRLFDGR